MVLHIPGESALEVESDGVNWKQALSSLRAERAAARDLSCAAHQVDVLNSTNSNTKNEIRDDLFLFPNLVELIKWRLSSLRRRSFSNFVDEVDSAVGVTLALDQDALVQSVRPIDVRRALKYARLRLSPERRCSPQPGEDLSLSTSATNGSALSSMLSPLSKVQSTAVHCNVHVALASLISSPYNNAECCGCQHVVLASQVLCNLVTNNFDSALALTRDIPLSDTVDGEVVGGCNFVGMIALAARLGGVDGDGGSLDGRGTIAAISATMYNCIASLENRDTLRVGVRTENVRRDEAESAVGNGLQDESTCDAVLRFTSDLAREERLVCNLLRQVIPVKLLTPWTTGSNLSDEKDDEDDDATEWITLLLGKMICSYGLLPQLYSSAGGTGEADLVTPEQVVLLNVAAHVVEFSFANFESKKSSRSGGDAECMVKQMVDFLSMEFRSTQCWLRSNAAGNVRESEFRESIFNSILDILASMLTGNRKDDNGIGGGAAKLRRYSGQQTSIMEHACTELGRVVDSITLTNSGRSTREFRISDFERKALISLVRLLGNLCFQCRENQDMLRMIEVPSSDRLSQSSALTTNSGNNKCAPLLSSSEAIGSTIGRTALHVLMTCTSFAHSCFGLREWSVVAIRNALEDNTSNQEFLQKLLPQEAVDTPELRDMGIQIDVDRYGKVNVKPKE